MTLELLAELESRLVSIAKDRTWSSKGRRPELLLPTHRATEVAQMFGEHLSVPSKEQFSNKFSVLSFENCTLLLASLGSDLDDWQSALQGAHSQAAKARSKLDDMEESDLYLLLVGPSESARNEKWQDVARTIERDERICRKLVWLPASMSQHESDLDAFCERTFLAQPWGQVGDHEQLDLDPVVILKQELGAAWVKETTLNESIFARWLQILDETPESELVKALIDAVSGAAS